MSIKNDSKIEIQQNVREFVKDHQVQQLLMTELTSLPQNLTIQFKYNKIYITIKTTYNHSQQQREPIQSVYVIKISKSFPLNKSVRIHLLNAPLQPRLSDSRDLFQDIMQKPYNYTIHLAQLISPLIQFDQKLLHKNQLFLQMQRIGNFNLCQTFYYHQLIQNFSSLSLLKDISTKKKNKIYVGITDTHILIFKQLGQHIEKHHMHHKLSIGVNNQKQLSVNLSQETYDKLMLVVSAQLQCIESLWYLQSQKIIRVTFKRYKSIKSYYEPEEIKKQFIFNEPEVFLRGVLKYISKFQQSLISFKSGLITPIKIKKPKSDPNIKQKQSQYIFLLIEQINTLEEKRKKDNIESQMKEKVQQLIKLYQKIIQYYSARANPYYLIYVAKLNHIYKQFYMDKQNNQNRQISNK